MAIQTFTALQVLTAAQMNALQANDYNQTVSTKVASYTLVAADKGTRIVMNAGATNTTITVNTSLFAAGDTLQILNTSTSGICTITAGTATVATAGSLALGLNQGGILYFTSTGVAVFQANGVGGGTRIGQVVSTNLATTFSSAATAYADITGLTVNITPTLATSKVLVLVSFSVSVNADANIFFQQVRDSTAINIGDAASNRRRASVFQYMANTSYNPGSLSWNFLDSPATTSATTYKVQGYVSSGTMFINRSALDTDNVNNQRTAANITVMEVIV